MNENVKCTMDLNRTDIGNVMVFLTLPQSLISRSLRFRLSPIKKEVVSADNEPTGIKVLDVPACATSEDFFTQIEALGFSLSNATIREKEKVFGGKTMHVVGLTFAKKGFNKPYNITGEDRKVVLAEIKDIFGQSMWITEGYENPLYLKLPGGYVPVNGKKSIGLNLKGRTPLKDKNGDPVMRWNRDEFGEKIDKNVVKPDFILQVQDGAIMPVK